MSDLPYSPVELACFARDYADIEWMLHISSPGRDRVITTDAFGEPLTPIEAFRWTHRVNSLSIEDDPAAATVFHFGTPANQGDWLVYSWEHDVWWMPAGWGYTGDRTEAGRYSEDEARGICERTAYGWREGNPPEVMIPADAEDWQAAIKQATTEFIKTRGTDNATPAEPTRIEAVVTLRKAEDR